MIEIDGSYGEGGGQILRTAISLSAVTGNDVKISNIRAGRQNPGLAPQHIASIEAVAELANAEVEGVYKGSKDVVFRPGQLVGGSFEFDIGTAGAVSLVAMNCLLPAAMSKGPVEMTIKGGTDVRWAPPIDFLTMVHLPIFRLFGGACSIDLISRGFYPEGGGEIAIDVSPTGGLGGVDLGEGCDLVRIEGVTYAQNLPEHVTARMKHSAMKELVGFRDVKIVSDVRRGMSTGAGMVLVATCRKTVLGASALGQKGVRSEELGESCACDLKETIASGASVDEHMLDQVLPYMAFASGVSRVLAEEVTSHAETNIWVIEKFLGKRFAIERKGRLVEIRTI